MLDFGKGDSINQALAPGGVPLGIGQMRQRGFPLVIGQIQVGGGSPLAKYGQGGVPLGIGQMPCDKPNMSNRQILAYMPLLQGG